MRIYFSFVGLSYDFRNLRKQRRNKRSTI